MQRWLTIVLGVAVILLAAALVAKSFTPPKPLPHAGADGGATDGGAAASLEGGADANAALTMDFGDGGLPLLSDLAPAEMRADAGIWGRLSDGTPVPGLPPNAPKTVKFGVVLISYAGAQGGPVGEKPNPRTKGDAKELAEKLAAEAKTDFHAAVQRGDPGSSDDVGRVRVGFLEPIADYNLFSLAVGDVSPAFDTPRGYWIVKRLE
jgi:hypothetical protein